MSLFGIGRCHRRRFYELPKLLFAVIFGWWLVETKDFDGERRLRRLYQDDEGRMRARGIMNWIELLPDGTVANGSFIKTWTPVCGGRMSVAAVDPSVVTQESRPRALRETSR